MGLPNPEFQAAAKADIFAVLNTAPNEVPALLAALKEGRIDGSVYSGECCCLVGTLARARGVLSENLPCRFDVGLSQGLAWSESAPAERWFVTIEEGDKPENDSRVALTVEWVEEWMVQHSARPQSGEA